jgi:hypothetical protein
LIEEQSLQNILSELKRLKVGLSFEMTGSLINMCIRIAYSCNFHHSIVSANVATKSSFSFEENRTPQETFGVHMSIYVLNSTLPLMHLKGST